MRSRSRARPPRSDNGSPDFTSYTAHLPARPHGIPTACESFFIDALYRSAVSAGRAVSDRPQEREERVRARPWILDVVRRHVRVRANFRGNREFLSPPLFEYVNAKFPFCTVLRKPSQSRRRSARGRTILRFMSVEEHKIVHCVIPRSVVVAVKGLCKCFSASRVHMRESGSRCMKM